METIKNKINELEAKRFYLSMKDRWTSADHAQDREWQEELRTLRQKEC